MTDVTPDKFERLRELLADEQLGALSIEDRAELEALRDTASIDPEFATVFGELLVACDAADDDAALPDALRTRLVTRGRQIVAGDAAAPIAGAPTRRIAPGSWLALAAALAIVIAGAIIATRLIGERERALVVARNEVATLVARVEANEQLLADARAQTTDVNERNLELAQRLADSTSDLRAAQDRIAMFEAPADPATLQRNRQRLLGVPDVVQVAWAPFDLGADNLAEQREVEGDVVWSPSRQEGYLRFVGLKVNDPAVEQYQVWIIDERGMEQKVSGGVFNATAQGEVIVPIEPGIDVGRVQLFAITIEEPGGIWVPNLERRVTVAPVEES